MPYYVQMPQNEYFNTEHGWRVIEGYTQPWELAPDMLEIVVTAPEDFRRAWHNVLMIHGWVETEGPVRRMEYEEYKALVADIINRNPEAAETGMVTFKDGTRSLLVVARVGLFGLRSLLHDDPIAFYELVTATRDPEHQFFGNYAACLRERGLLDANDRPAGSFRNLILNAVEGEEFGMKLVNPERGH